MRVNEKTAIATGTALLVPYEAHHVRKYHSWMQEPAIQEATASEPMTLDEEYENQQSWRTSPDKLTFIVCAPLQDGAAPLSSESAADFVEAKREDDDEHMRGDINFFLYPYEADSDEEAATADAQGWCTGEVDVMIASTAHRRLGLGRAAVCALLVYIQQHVDAILGEFASAAADDDDDDGAAAAVVAQGQQQQQQQQHGRPAELKSLMVKIKQENAGSRALFERLGFVQKGEVNYFGEVVMVLSWAGLEQTSWWGSAKSDYREVGYRE